jgi:hypothetical protein
MTGSADCPLNRSREQDKRKANKGGRFVVLCAGNVRFHAKLFIVRGSAILEKEW